MDVIEKFEYRLIEWLNKNGFPSVNVELGIDFGYYKNIHLIEYSLFIQEQCDKEFEQFFYEYGCRNSYNNFVRSFLHELGHHMTLPNFNDEEYNSLMDTLQLAHEAVKCNPQAGEYFNRDWYWHMPHEFAANIWAINFINEHNDAVSELNAIIDEGLDSLYSDPEIYAALEELLKNLQEEIEEE